MRLFHFIVSHSIFVSLCAAALCFQTYLLLQLEVDFAVCKLIFFSTLGSYNLYWIFCRYAFNKNAAISVADSIVNLLLFILAVFGVSYYLVYRFILIPYVGVAFILTACYMVSVLPTPSVLKINKWGYLKTILLAFTWSFATVVIPAYSALSSLSSAIFFLVFTRFLFVLILCIIFDLRDVSIDKIQGINSIATYFSKSSVHVMVFAVCMIDIVILLLFSKYYIDSRQSIVLMLAALLSICCYFLSLIKERSYYFYYFLVDGLMLFTAFASYLATI